MAGNRCVAQWRRAPGNRGVAQLGSALRSGRRGRAFKSPHPDYSGCSEGSRYNDDMPYADPAVQSAYQNERLKRLRLEWVTEHGPCVDCKRTEQLTVDHVDAAKKVTHRVWSWSEARREAELAKCVVRCWPCHLVKTALSGERPRGEHHGLHVLTTGQVWEIRQRVRDGESQAAVARAFDVDRRHVWDLVHRRTRQYE